jgi:hypothetical protein
MQTFSNIINDIINSENHPNQERFSINQGKRIQGENTIINFIEPIKNILLENNINNEEISRSEIDFLFNQGKYKPEFLFLIVMFWGGKDNQSGFFNYIEINSEDFIIKTRNLFLEMEKLSTITDLDLFKLELEKLWISCSSGTTKIPGIGYPFFTKIFQFALQRHPVIKPLIMDEHLQVAYLAYVCEFKTDYKKFILQFLTQKQFSNFIDGGRINYVRKKMEFDFYWNFISDFNQFAKQNKITPVKLEEICFGFGKKNKKIRNQEIINTRLFFRNCIIYKIRLFTRK